MRKAAEVALTVFITFTGTLLLNALLNYLQGSKAIVSIGARVVVQGVTLRAVEISNRTSEPLDNLLLQIPKSTRAKEIGASVPLQITDVPDNVGMSDMQRVRLTGVAPRHISRLLIPVPAQGATDDVSVINGDQIGIEVLMGDLVPNPLRQAFMSGLFDSVIYGLIIGLAFFVSDSRFQARIDGVKDELKRIESNRSELLQRIGSLEGALRDARNTSARLRLLLLAQLNDYRRELDFWRDSIRRVLYARAGKDDAERLFNSVTATLGTYGTRKATTDIDSVAIMAKMLRPRKGSGSAPIDSQKAPVPNETGADVSPGPATT
jgi:hypothetical protein